MKKLLILMLVLGLTTVANAALQLSVNGITDGGGNTTDITGVSVSTEIVIDVHGTPGTNWLGYIEILGVPATASGDWGDAYPAGAVPGYYVKSGYPIIYGNAGDMASVQRYIEAIGFGYELSAASSPAQGFPAGGRQFDLMFHCLRAGDAVINVWQDPDYDTPQDTIVIHQTSGVPEPVTIMLLGLGGLLLRRRK